jgi:small-conductance mechanosensitive channel
MTLERRQAQIERSTVIGLLALAVAFLAAAARSTAVHLEWLAADAAAVRLLQFIWIIGLVLFGLAFGWLSVLGRRLEAQERMALGDELQVLLSRKSAVSAYMITFIVAVVIAAIPGSERLPGNAVASAIVGVGAATLALQRLWSDPT